MHIGYDTMSIIKAGSLAAIVCEHVAIGSEPIRVAVRTSAEDSDDSGWQFLCGSGRDESVEAAQVWLLSEVVERNPSLERWMNCPVGTRLERTTENSPWTQVR